METKVYRLDENNLDLEKIKEAAHVINRGGTVVLPTETVYGLGADGLNSEAVKKIFIAKGRPQDNPLIMHVCKKDISEYAKNIPQVAYKLIDKFWPGPLTLILDKADIIPKETSAGLDTIGIRMPRNSVALKLIEMSGRAIAAPSANLSGKPSPTEMKRCVEDLNGKVDIILGGNESEIGLESTIVDCTGDRLCILRPGAITLDMIKEFDDQVYIDPAILKNVTDDFKPKAPGMKYRHYAPKAKMKIICGEEKKTIEKIKEIVQNYIDANLRVGIMTCDEHINEYDVQCKISLGSNKNLEEISKNLFETLRSFDELDVDIIISEGFEEKGIGLALMNRLKKAAGYDIEFV
ncbi:L-threonylcarbamoyladenylate synthase [Oceanirhabdus sp. W0125-5]|uniref:L-threonylcarbamoyladenylate synthase n=1 Tax=Oceanirhabdus sp. W0125-5 TaxID=2999116 RepID=UPI0022F33288|nr:L-threonylcarbamoyladenylate synthase [Oceanirhabdus sp. W0125-5]WBW98480.1 L-threonylcarbamoyladenylate synthase [Oceanirhabdus sp. W0125-5]